jgi:hypothetical protein
VFWIEERCTGLAEIICRGTKLPHDSVLSIGRARGCEGRRHGNLVAVVRREEFWRGSRRLDGSSSAQIVQEVHAWARGS